MTTQVGLAGTGRPHSLQVAFITGAQAVHTAAVARLLLHYARAMPLPGDSRWPIY